MLAGANALRTPRGAMSARMRAVTIPHYGGPEVLEVRETERPTAGTERVLVRVRATALNRADLLQRQGRYPAPPGAPAEIPGLEFAGEVVELGPGASLWKEGDRVFGITGGGGHAEYLAVHERAIAGVPESLGWVQAAAVPEVFITAHDALVTQARVRPSERVLVYAVGSGVGLAAIQLARACGAIPYGTARTADKIDRARTYGLEDGIVIAEWLGVVSDAAMEWTSGQGMDVILDLVGGEYLAAGVRAAGLGGRIVLIGTLAGTTATVPLGQAMSKRLTIRGTVLRARPLEEKIAATRAFAKEVVPLLARGVVRPVVDRVYPLHGITEAHEYLEGNQTFGKVVIEVS